MTEEVLTFFEAIRNGDLDTVQSMLKRDSALLYARSAERRSPILAAAYWGQNEIAEFLADRTVLLNIYEAAALGRVSQIIRILAKHPEMVDACGEDGFPPLSVAARFGQIEVVEFLIRASAPLNLPANNPLKTTPLHAAVEGRQIETARLLLQHGADPNVRRADGATPLHLAAQSGQIEMILLLLFNGADLKIKDDAGKIPLDWATEAKQEKTAELLRTEITKRFRKMRARALRKS